MRTQALYLRKAPMRVTPGPPRSFQTVVTPEWRSPDPRRAERSRAVGPDDQHRTMLATVWPEMIGPPSAPTSRLSPVQPVQPAPPSHPQTSPPASPQSRAGLEALAACRGGEPARVRVLPPPASAPATPTKSPLQVPACFLPRKGAAPLALPRPGPARAAAGPRLLGPIGRSRPSSRPPGQLPWAGWLRPDRAPHRSCSSGDCVRPGFASVEEARTR